MKVINLFGGPGTGKSTNAAKLFAKMKEKGYSVEYVTEYAKDVVYSKEFFKLTDQLMVFAKQNHKLWRLRDQVDYAIVDSPLILSSIYAPSDMIYDKVHLDQIVTSTFNSYDNLNVFLTRDVIEHPYQEYGRTQTLIEAVQIDAKILKHLDSYSIPYNKLDVNKKTAKSILKLID